MLTTLGPPGQCNTCLTRWGGENCDTCARGWAGGNCSICATNFRPAGQCDRCLTGWDGDNCNYCEGFGFSIESNCTECIQNGAWIGSWVFNGLTLHLTFDGPACNNVVPGIYKYT